MIDFNLFNLKFIDMKQTKGPGGKPSTKTSKKSGTGRDNNPPKPKK